MSAPTERAIWAPAEAELCIRLEPRVLSPRRRVLLSALLLLTLFLSGQGLREQGWTGLGTLLMAGAILAFAAVLRWGAHALVARASDAVNGGLFLVAAATRFAHGKHLLPSLQVLTGGFLIAVAVLDLPSRRGSLRLGPAGLHVRRSRLRRRFLAWGVIASWSQEGRVLRFTLADGTVEELVAAQPLAPSALERLRAELERARGTTDSEEADA